MYSTTALNLAMCYSILVIMAIIFVHSLVFGKPEIIDVKKHPSTGISFLLWAFVWLNTALVYHFLSGQFFLVTDHYGVVLIFLNIGNMAIFGSAIAYARGDRLNPKKDFTWLIGLLVFLMFWNLVSQRFVTGFIGMTITIAPSVILSAISLMFFGWVFFVRWGGFIGSVYFLCVGLYAILQLPAYVAIFLKPFLGSNQDVGVIFSLLAGMKIPLISGFMVLLLNSSLLDVKISEERIMPSVPVTLPDPMNKALYWIVGVLVTAALTAMTKPIWRSLVAAFKTTP